MFIKSHLNYSKEREEFSVVEDNLLFKIPFIVIYLAGRKLIYYSGQTTTPVKNWYDGLDNKLRSCVSILPIGT